jgi:hypothetical protein
LGILQKGFFEETEKYTSNHDEKVTKDSGIGQREAPKEEAGEYYY